MATATFLNSTVKTVRKTRRAYIGAHVLAFEFAQKRASMRLEQLKTIGTLLVAKGEIMEKDAVSAVDMAKEKIVGLIPRQDEAVVTVDVKPTRVVKTAKRADMTTDITPKSKASQKPKAK